jgi:hypothetical protein
MKIKFLSVILIFYASLSFGETEIPNLDTSGKSISELIPDEWTVLSSTIGYLNGDGIDDMAFALKNNDLTNYEPIRNGTDSIDMNPRVLAIYFKNADGTYKKQLQSNHFILLKDSPTMDEPFDGLTIESNGVLRIDFHFWFSAGSWYMSNHQHKFRYQNNQFELIGYESSSTHRGTMKTTEHSINFSTNKMKITETVFNEETEEEKTTFQWKNIELERLKTVTSLKKPFEWTFEGIQI